MNKNLPAYLAEFFATFALVFFGVGAIMTNQLMHGSLGLLGIATAHALALVVMVMVTINISGAHINPAVTLAMLVTRRISVTAAIGYICSQLLGAYYGVWVLDLFFPEGLVKAVSYGMPMLQHGMTYKNGIIVEAILTFFLVLSIFGSAVDERGPKLLASFAIGLAVFMDILVGGPFTGAAMNPARAFGPTLLSGNWVNHSLYWIGPIAGALLAAIIYDGLLIKKREC